MWLKAVTGGFLADFSICMLCVRIRGVLRRTRRDINISNGGQI